MFGGNFLHGYQMGTQLAIYELEQRAKIPTKFQYPHYEKMQWYALQHYHKILIEQEAPIAYSEMEGLFALVEFLESVAETEGYESKLPFACEEATRMLQEVKAFLTQKE